MREILIKLFGTTRGNVSITLFSVWHFLYILIIVGGSFLTALLLKGRSTKSKTEVLDILSYAVPIVYILDFFIMPLSQSDFSINVDKLPFHICTVMAFFIPLVQFNHRLKGLKTPVVCLSLVASLMYITYPGTAIGDILPWCYRVVQTFLYHGLMFAWGFLHLTTGQVVLKYRNIWKELMFIFCMVVWATLGNSIYSNETHIYDWFFVNGVTFPFVPEPLMPLTVIAAVFGMCAIIYGIYTVASRIILKERPLSVEETPSVPKSESGVPVYK